MQWIKNEILNQGQERGISAEPHARSASLIYDCPGWILLAGGQTVPSLALCDLSLCYALNCIARIKPYLILPPLREGLFLMMAMALHSANDYFQ